MAISRTQGDGTSGESSCAKRNLATFIHEKVQKSNVDNLFVFRLMQLDTLLGEIRERHADDLPFAWPMQQDILLRKIQKRGST